jgi:NAD+ synthase (glutamine-hydrolysing)
MKIRVEQLNPVIGDFSSNKREIIESLHRAEKSGIDLLILPELVTTGYPPLDLLERRDFLDACFRANDEIIQKTRNTALLFGTVTPNRSDTGRKICNSALLARNGEQIGRTDKTLLPTYDIFDDLRYFEPASGFECLELDGVRLGVTVCEDIWHNENEVQYVVYDTDPAKELKKLGADVIINVSASPYTNTKHEGRLRMLQNHARKLDLPVLYSNQAGAQTDVIYDGDSMALAADGSVVARTKIFEPSFADVQFDTASRELTGPDSPGPVYPGSLPERQFEAIRCGLRNYIKKTGVSDSVVLGLSGGIDSALVCALAVETLGADKVKAFTMPARFSSEGSVKDSEHLAENLGIELIELPIEKLFDGFQSALKPVFRDLPFGVAEENLQSRIRGTILMAYSNKFSNLLLATGNKSEFAVGYATLYGDMNGALAIIGDLYKTEVFTLCKWLNSSYYKHEVIPDSILAKPPSAELRPDQKDSDSLPDYEVLDDILFRYIERQQSIEEISRAGHSEEIVHKVVQMVDRNEFKRFQSAPILKLGSRSFGPGRRQPLVQNWTGYFSKK